MTTTDVTPTDARQQRGMVIARTMKIQQGRHGWRVPSQSFVGTYAVWGTAQGHRCSCPDFEQRQLPCKHIYAVMQFTLFRQTEQTPEGNTVVTTAATARITYSQDWAAYNAAQTTEKATFLRLLHGLCANIPEPPQEKGRPRLPLRDMVFAGGFKVYSTVSARRFMTDLRSAQEQGLIARAPHYNSIFNYLESPALTPIIRNLVTESSLPLKAIETDFAADSTGFGTCRSFHYYDMRYGSGAGTERSLRDWLKLHAMIGCRTNIITSVEVTERRQHDTTQFVPLLQDTAKNFNVFRVYADGAYSSVKNVEAATALGAKPFIPFRVDARGNQPSEAWSRLFHLFSLNRDAFLAVYHRRSNVEATFSMMKRKFGDRLRSKTPVAQVNELLLKVLAHNLCCLVHAIHELRLGVPTFGAAAD